MAEEETGQEKTEEPTAKRLKDAKEMKSGILLALKSGLLSYG
ncbi:MAG: flagellar biosynthesis protein FlhB [Motiliproteus sp.]|jgi:flagellar biosynthesis protein FlhB